MIKKMELMFALCVIAFVSCKQQENLHPINELPMYGNIKKAKDQIHYDSVFIKEMLLKYHDNNSASIAAAKLGWKLFKQGDKQTAIKRFNQSWLLDSLCPYAFWGFGDYTGSYGNFPDAITFLKKAIMLLPNDVNLLSDLAFTYGMISYTKKSQISKDTAMISDSIFKLAFKIDSSNIVVLNQWILTKYLLGDCVGAHDLRARLLNIDSQSVDIKTISRMKNDLNIKCND